MRAVASFVAGRRTKWVVVAVWVLAVIALSPLGSKLQDETQDDTTSFLPESAESTEVVRVLDDEFDAGETSNGLIVYQGDGRLTAPDRAKIRQDARQIARAPEDGEGAIPLTEPPLVPFAPGAPPDLVSSDGDVAYTVLTVPTDFDQVADWGKEIRKITGEESDGMRIFLTGDVGFNTDAEEVFGDLDQNLLLATVVLVLVLLGSIYRAVLIALSPLIVVFIAYTVAQAFIYLLAKSGATVSSNSTGIMIVLMFGVGTDYCLLLVSRYREELRVIEDKHEAMARAVRRSGPAIFASGLTVTLAMLVLALADSQNTASFGPVAAIGVFSAMVASITLLPALLTIFGRNGFWPRRRMVEYDPEHPAMARQGIWRRFGDRVLQRPALALTVTLLVFCAGALGLLAYKVDYSTTTFFKKSVEAVEGFELLEESFPAGTNAPMTAVIESEDGTVTPEEVDDVVRRVETLPSVAAVNPTGQVSADGTKTTIEIVLDQDPYTIAALDQVPKIRSALDDLEPELTVLVGGGSAIQYDFDQATESDLRLIVPVTLLVIAIILAILLRALVAPLVLIASVVISFLCTLGISVLFIRFVVGDAGFDASIPSFAFIFLVALGIDYTIFLMARVREEAREHGTREGMLRALAVTGPVITSAGIILAGTFSVLMTLPVTFTFDLGFMVALGILLDTFIVRTIMVPAAVELIGDKVWWPSTAQGTGALHEGSAEHELAEHPGSDSSASP